MGHVLVAQWQAPGTEVSAELDAQAGSHLLNTVDPLSAQPVLRDAAPRLFGVHDVVMGGTIAEAMAWNMGFVDDPDGRVARRRLGASWRPQTFAGWLRFCAWRNRCATVEDAQRPWLFEPNCLAPLGEPFTDMRDVFEVHQAASAIYDCWPALSMAAEELLRCNDTNLATTRSILGPS